MIDFKELAQYIDLDIEQWYVPYIKCKQHDAKSRYLKFKLFNRGEIVNIDDHLTIFYCYFRKSDGKEVFSTMTKEDGYLVVELTSQTLAKEGKVEGELVIVQQGSILTSRPFILDVIKTNTRGTGAVESTNEYEGLTDALVRVEELIAQLKDLDTIMVFSHVIDVTNVNAGKILSFATFNDYDPKYNLEIHLSGVKLIENVDYTVDKDNRTITAQGARQWVNGDQLLLQCFKRGRSAIQGDNSIDATQVNVKPPLFQGSNNVYTTLITLNSNLGGSLDRLDTADKGSLINAINELNTKINDIQNKVPFQRLENVINLPLPQKTINIGIPDYDPNTDILDVYMQGLKLVENTGYTLNRVDRTITCLDGDFNKQVVCEVIKVN